MMTRLQEAKAFAHALESAPGAHALSLMVEKWSPAARAAAAAARKAKGGGQDWRKAGRKAYLAADKAPWRGARDGAPAHDPLAAWDRGDSRDPAVKRAMKRASKVGEEPLTWQDYEKPKGRAYTKSYNADMKKSYARRRARFAGA